MAVNYKVNDQIVFTQQVDTLTEGTTGKIKRFIGCSCKPDIQGAIIEVDGKEHIVVKFRTKVSLLDG